MSIITDIAVAGTAADDTAVSIPAVPGEWPAWIDDQKIRAAFDFEHVDDRSHLARLAAGGFNTVLLSFAALDVDTPEQIALLDKQAGWCAELGLRMFVMTRLCGDKTELRHLVPGGRSYVDRNGFTFTRTPCPGDPVFWDKVVTRRARLVAEQSLTLRIDGYMLDPEMYASDDSQFPGYCYCEYCFREFFEHRSLTVEMPLPAGRVSWLQKQGLQKSYAVWKEERAEALARAAEQAAHKVNPNLVLGVLVLDVDRWYYNAWARGFGTVKMPVIAFSESTYTSGATEYLQRARKHLKDIKAHAVLCPSIWAQKFPPEEIAAQLFSLAQEDSIGYWVFSTYGFSMTPQDPPTNDFTFPPPHERYFKAFSLAAQELDRQKQEGGKFTPKLKLVRRDPPQITVYDDGLLSPAVELYPFDPKGQTARPNEEPTRLRYEAAFYVLVTSGKTISAALNTYSEGVSDQWPQYLLIAPSGKIAAEGGLTVDNPVSLSMEAEETGLYKLALRTKGNIFSVALNMPHVVQSVNDTVSIVKHANRMYFYVPEDCTEFFIKVSTPYLAEQAQLIVWAPDGKEAASVKTVELKPAQATLNPTSGHRGKVWSFQMIPLYYSVNLTWDPRLPPYISESPQALLIPR